MPKTQIRCDDCGGSEVIEHDYYLTDKEVDALALEWEKKHECSFLKEPIFKHPHTLYPGTSQYEKSFVSGKD